MLRSWTRLLMSAALGTILVACGEAESPSIPSPEVVDTAEAVARDVRIRAEYSTTPTPEDEGRSTEIVLDARVFGNGENGVIFAHMRTADQTSWFPIATSLSRTGAYTILTFDFRGYGKSTGEKEFNRVDTDLLAVMEYMREELGVGHIVLVGASMGATAALIVGADNDIAGVASLSALATFQDVDAISAVSRIDAPKLFIAAEEDVPATRSLEELAAQARAPTSEVLFPGSAHGTDLFAEPFGNDVERLLVDFLEANRR